MWSPIMEWCDETGLLFAAAGGQTIGGKEGRVLQPARKAQRSARPQWQ